MSAEGRVTDYDSIAGSFDRRYSLLRYDGVRDALVTFLTPGVSAALEVGCGTGHWLRELAGRAPLIAGVEPCGPMLVRARDTAPAAQLARGCAEQLPWRDASFDRIFCVNALHHFADRGRFFAEARRVLRPGGGVMSIGKDPHRAGDEWWVYDYFDGTRAIDLARFAPVRTLRAELTTAGFAWAESFEADRIETTRGVSEAFAAGIVDRAFTSQLTVLTDEEFSRGVERIRQAESGAQKDGTQLTLIADFRLYATVGWLT
jgi:ubiquinone/menaquinone biosynthesis C-methylase UbiE